MKKILDEVQKELDALNAELDARGVALSHEDTLQFMQHEFMRLMGDVKPEKMN